MGQIHALWSSKQLGKSSLQLGTYICSSALLTGVDGMIRWTKIALAIAIWSDDLSYRGDSWLNVEPIQVRSNIRTESNLKGPNAAA